MNASNQLEKSTYYVLDAQGKSPWMNGRRRQAGELAPRLGGTMAVYEREINNTASTITFTQEEKHIYGATRLGVMNDSIPLLGSQNDTYTQTTWVHTIGKRMYELSNHLGNVLSVISDKVIPHVSTGTTVDYFLADIRQSTDYSPFGVTLEGRNFTASGADGFRFGFNGMESDDEVKGEKNSYTTEFRQYDPRIGRWLSLDPMFAKFPDISPYVAFNNNPIYFADPFGLEGEPKIGETRGEGSEQEVYIGTGWSCTNQTINFQADGGNAIFVRGGQEGSYTYQKIETVIISINGDYGFMPEYSEQVVGKEAWLIASTDIENAAKVYKEKFGGLTIGTMVIRTHGGTTEDSHTGIGIMSGLALLTNNGDADPVTKYGMLGARKNNKEGLSENEYNDAFALVSLFKNVKSGGCLVLSSCTIGQDKDLIKQISYAAKGVNIFCNMDYSSSTFDKNELGIATAVSITTSALNYKLGWVKYGIINQNDVDSYGAKPKYDLTPYGNKDNIPKFSY